MSEILAQLAGAGVPTGGAPPAGPPMEDPFGGLPPSIPDPEAAAAGPPGAAPPGLGAEPPPEAGPPPAGEPPAGGGGDEVDSLKQMIGLADSYKQIDTVTEQERAAMEKVTTLLQTLLAQNEKMSQQMTGATPALTKAFGGPG